MRSYDSLGKSLSIIGVLTLVSGMIFLLQSKSVVGPSSSFMYRNPEWTENGYIIIVMGVIVFAIGLIMNYLRADRKPKIN
jgi:uncharacterized membrane protein YidH (DUF202 family)